MENEKLQIVMAPGTDKAELVVRDVKTVNELPVKAPVKLTIIGILTAPYEFLLKRKDEPEQILEVKTHILVDREKLSIELIYNEDNEYKRGVITGKLDFNDKFKEFGINTGKVWTPTALGLFFKMNRAFFTTKEDNLRLVSELMNFTATVNNSIERMANEKGDRTDKFAQMVNSNLPKSFSLVIPIFKGKPSETIEVETFAQVDGRDVAFTLISPGAQEILENIRNKAIDEQIDLIRALCPGIAIMEV